MTVTPPRAADAARAFLACWSRRALTIPGYLALTLVALGLLPLVLLVATAADGITRRPFPLTRTALFLSYYFLCESVGLGASFVVWLAAPLADGRRSRRYLEWNFRLQCVWARLLLRGAERLFGFRLTVEGDESGAHGPMLLFVRHASVADTLLPATFLSDRHGLRLRYVLKRELLWEPCLDVVGRRLPNIFVDRSSVQSDREIEAVRRLARTLGPDEGVLIYPEGTRFTPRKRERALARLASSSNARLLPRARALRHVLPPRLGGPLALLDECPGTDVVFCAHTGLEGTTSFRELWRGEMIGRTVRVCFWRISGNDIPTDRDGRIDWLYAQWARMDAWVEAARSTGDVGA